eukprot:1833402-Lingulodinium_polyedra.AAC.1
MQSIVRTEPWAERKRGYKNMPCEHVAQGVYGQVWRARRVGPDGARAIVVIKQVMRRAAEDA